MNKQKIGGQTEASSGRQAEASLRGEAGASLEGRESRETESVRAGKRISRNTVETLLEQNRRMRELLQTWPPRKIMMDFEKEWNEKRLRFLHHNPPVSLENSSE